MTVAKLLKSRLKANRWNLYHLADHAGITNDYLSRIMRNRADASQTTKIALALFASKMTGTKYIPSDFDITTSTEN